MSSDPRTPDKDKSFHWQRISSIRIDEHCVPSVGSSPESVIGFLRSIFVFYLIFVSFIPQLTASSSQPEKKERKQTSRITPTAEGIDVLVCESQRSDLILR